MSQEGYDELVAELQHMVNVELPAVRDAIAEARDKGDLSENFEYHAAKRTTLFRSATRVTSARISSIMLPNVSRANC